MKSDGLVSSVDIMCVDNRVGSWLPWPASTERVLGWAGVSGVDTLAIVWWQETDEAVC